MESRASWTRLLCGDVGYGKTEVALRAIFKCVMGGKAAALLAPTTILVQQHYATMMNRFHGFPVKVIDIRIARPRRNRRKSSASWRRGNWTWSSAPTACSART